MKPNRRFTRLLAPISFAEKTDAVINHVRRIAEVNEGEVVLMHVVPTQSYRLHRAVYRPEEAGGADEEHAEKVVRELLENLGRKLGRVPWRIRTPHASNPAQAILDAAHEIDADLIIVSKSESSELAARIQGGLHEKLIRSSDCAVWGVSSLPKYAEQESVKNVLAPVGFERASVAVTHLAGSIAEAQHGRVRLLHIIRPEASSFEVNRPLYGFAPDEPLDIAKAQRVAKEKLDRFAAEHLGELPHETVVAVANDRATAILEDEKSWKPDVIAMGTAGFTGFFQFVLGSAAETVARRSRCDVVTLRLR